MYETVPTRCDSRRPCSSRSVTRPKSRSTTRPSRVTRMFDGLMSRWTFCARCSAARPSASCAKRGAQARLVGARGEPAARGCGRARGRRSLARAASTVGRPPSRPRVPPRRARRAPLVRASSSARPDVVEEVDAAHQLHREEPALAVLEQLAQRDEVRVLDVRRGRGTRCLKRSRASGLSVRSVLSATVRVALAVERLVDDAHAARAEAAHAPRSARSRRSRLPVSCATSPGRQIHPPFAARSKRIHPGEALVEGASHDAGLPPRAPPGCPGRPPGSPGPGRRPLPGRRDPGDVVRLGARQGFADDLYHFLLAASLVARPAPRRRHLPRHQPRLRRASYLAGGDCVAGARPGRSPTRSSSACRPSPPSATA